MGDVFIEKIVPQKRSLIDYLKIVAILILYTLLLLICLSLQFLLFLFPLVLFGGAYLVYLFIVMTRLEHEYIITNGVIDIDRIYGKRRRKRQLSINIKDIYDTDKVGSNKYANHLRNKNLKVLDFSSKDEKNDIRYILTNSRSDKLILIDYDSKIFETIMKSNRKLSLY